MESSSSTSGGYDAIIFKKAATMKHRDWCWENWAATSKSVHHKVRQEMNNDRVNVPDSESCLWDFIYQVWRHKTHKEEIFITIHQCAGLRTTHEEEIFFTVHQRAGLRKGGRRGRVHGILVHSGLSLSHIVLCRVCHVKVMFSFESHVRQGKKSIKRRPPARCSGGEGCWGRRAAPVPGWCPTRWEPGRGRRCSPPAAVGVFDACFFNDAMF